MTVERFKFEYVEVDDEWELQLDDDGDYVSYADYQKLEDDIAVEMLRVEMDNARLANIKDALEAENATLVASIKTAIFWFDGYPAMDYASHGVKKLLQKALGE